MTPSESPAAPSSATDPYRGLVRVSCSINSIHDYRELLTSLLQTTKEVMNCEAGSLMLYNEATDDLSWHVVLGEKADRLAEMGRLPMGKGVAGWVAQQRKPALVADTSVDERFFRGADTKTGFQTRSILCVPLLLGDRLVGVLQALNPCRKKAFDEADLEVFQAYGAMAATAIEKIRWQDAMLQQQKTRHDLETAREIQSRFLAQDFPETRAALQLAFHYQPASQIGGDFYDVQAAPNGAFALILGDVTGKGVPAALLMAQVLSEFRHAVLVESDPGRILVRMNDSLAARSARGMFATAWCAVAYAEGERMEVRQASAGHLAPLRRSTTGADFLEVPSGPPLGIMPGLDYESSSVRLERGEWLCLYSDGITEGRDPSGAEFGAARLLETAAALPSDTAAAGEGLRRAIREFENGAPQRDDVTLLIFGPK